MNASNPDPFETRLANQPLRRPPREWRGEILAAANRAQAIGARAPVVKLPGGFLALLSEILWPSPVAWGALATVWLVLLVFNAASPGAPPVADKSSSPNSAFPFYAFREQNRLVRELIGPTETTQPTERRRQEPPPASPRSERQNPVAAV